MSPAIALSMGLTSLRPTLFPLIQAYSRSFGVIPFDNVTFSASIFSAVDGEVIYTVHNTAKSVQIATTGVRKVDGESVYRVGSFSKVLTAYTFLSEVGDGYWSRPITKFLPELEAAASNSSISDEIDVVQWQDVTLGELAGHLASIPRDATLGDLSAAISLGPKVPSSHVPTCGATTTEAPCSREQFFQYMLLQHPSFPTSATPAYSNMAYVLLGYAFEAITNKTVKTGVTTLFKKVGATRSSYNTADAS
ncbi:hypothetical protein MMC25_001802 [Agyrium rufum]|nr:hypothetical protein [Agyrium rufum]